MPIAQIAALALHLAIGYLYVISGLVVPPLFLILLLIVWATLLFVGLRHRNDLRFLAGMPALAALVWAAVVLGLGLLLDWEP